MTVDWDFQDSCQFIMDWFIIDITIFHCYLINKHNIFYLSSHQCHLSINHAGHSVYPTITAWAWQCAESGRRKIVSNHEWRISSTYKLASMSAKLELWSFISNYWQRQDLESYNILETTVRPLAKSANILATSERAGLELKGQVRWRNCKGWCRNLQAVEIKHRRCSGSAQDEEKK